MTAYLEIIAISLSAFFLSIWGTRLLIRHADLLNLIDVPNERSSHEHPMPRGGGLAFAGTFICGCLAFWASGIIRIDWLLPTLCGATIVTLIGWMDDRRSMPAASRLAVHFTAALLVYVFITKGFSTHVTISFVPHQWPLVTFLFAMFFVAWMLNLYNFMDGVDGLAGLNAVVASLCLAAISIWQNQLPLTAIYILLASCVAGFLVFNWSPAKIFMGDSGSTFLGFVFAATALTGKVMGNVAFVANVIILGCFIVDATYTLLVRFAQGKKIHQAHRDHAFQHAVQIGWSHRRVVIFYAAITVFWLVPLALAALIYEQLAFLFLFTAYTPLVVMQIYFKAGLEGQLPKGAAVIKVRLLKDRDRSRSIPN